MARKAGKAADPKKIVEKGDIFFLYRPRIDSGKVRSFEDVQRVYVVLRPARKHPRMRLLTVGRKRLPEIESHERSWGFVDLVTGSQRVLARVLGEERHETETRGTRTLPAARPAGEGVYALVRIGSRLFLAYEIEPPGRPGAVQGALNIARRAVLALSIKNPEARMPPGVGLREEEEADYPPQLLRELRGRRFASEDPRLLDCAGAEFVLVGAAADPERADDRTGEQETPDSADLLSALHLARDHQPIEPLITGSWR